MIARNPLHGSGRADFPHPALTSGDDAHAAQWKRMIDMRRRQPAVDQSPHPCPAKAGPLATVRQRPVPEPADPLTEQIQRCAVHGHSVVAEMPTYNRAQPLAYFRDGNVHTLLQLSFHLVQLRLQSLANCLPQHREVAVAPLLRADMREAEEVKSLRLSFTTLLPVLDRIRSELQKARLFGVQFEMELPKPLGEFRPEPFSIRLLLESDHDVVGVPHDDYIAVRLLSTPCLDPQVKGVMEIDVRQQRRCTAALWRSFLHPYSRPIFEHARVQPFLDEPHHAPVRYAMFDELHQPFVRDRIEKAADVQIEHPAHMLRQQSRVKRIQRVMLASPRTEPIRESEDATVIAVDANRNLITVERDTGGVVSYDPARVRGIDAYRETDKSFAVGDRLQMTAHYRDLDLPNRILGTVEQVTNGELTVRMDSGRIVAFDPQEMRHFDHGYAVTSHSSQGLTAERVLVNMDTEMHSNLINARFAYVSISRGSHAAHIFTNNAAGLGERLSHDSLKTSAINITKEEEPKLGLTQNQSLNKQAEVGVQLSM